MKLAHFHLDNCIDSFDRLHAAAVVVVVALLAVGLDMVTCLAYHAHRQYQRLHSLPSHSHALQAHFEWPNHFGVLAWLVVASVPLAVAVVAVVTVVQFSMVHAVYYYHVRVSHHSFPIQSLATMRQIVAFESFLVRTICCACILRFRPYHP